ncbi:MmcQ/YjbR family DNA-binding protein [Tropicimonas sediminicola]|uniref:MmcQ/YjbR family DNA-binding protein n=1 Tax=Tropicimonas sediminicola TaxID=1031541 RepID=UPI003183493C
MNDSAARPKSQITGEQASNARLAATSGERHTRGMDRDSINALCAGLPGADVSEPFGPGHDIWKVGGKIFAALGAEGRGVSVKCADVPTAEMLRETGRFEKAPYFHRSWVLVPFDAVDAEEAAHRVRTSYGIIRASLPKKVQAGLDPA